MDMNERKKKVLGHLSRVTEEIHELYLDTLESPEKVTLLKAYELSNETWETVHSITVTDMDI